MDAIKLLTELLASKGYDVDATASLNTPTQTGAVLRVTGNDGREFTIIIREPVEDPEEYSDSQRIDEMETAEDYNRFEENELARDAAAEWESSQDDGDFVSMDRESFGSDSWQSDGPYD